MLAKLPDLKDRRSCKNISFVNQLKDSREDRQDKFLKFDSTPLDLLGKMLFRFLCGILKHSLPEIIFKKALTVKQL